MSQSVVNHLNQQSETNKVAQMFKEIYALPRGHTAADVTNILKKYSFGYEWEKNTEDLNNSLQPTNISVVKATGQSQEQDLVKDEASNDQNKFIGDTKFSTLVERTAGETSPPPAQPEQPATSKATTPPAKK
jgi:aspartate/tyrosine/aromatic aminotransferase